MPPALPTTAFSCAYAPSLEVLTGHWAHAVPMTALTADYYHLLAAAQAHAGCCFWLLDMRLRNWPDEAFTQWFGEDFARQAAAALGQPLFIAYVLQPGQRAQVEASHTGRMLRQVAQHNIFPFFFDSEAAARAWLQHQQAGEAPAAGLVSTIRQLAY